MSVKNPKNIKVNLNKEFLKVIVYWIICKYNMDEFKREQSSSKTALLGGFIDRWMNKAPEFLIFDKLLENKDYSAIADTFLYDSSESKNAPDILGLIDKNKKQYPFARFKDTKWEIVEGTPFIEMKTFRNSQKLITIPYNQFHDDYYYAIVESHLEDNYLFSIFDKSLYEHRLHEYIMALTESEFIISNEKGIIKKPEQITENNDLGFYCLIGIYKGKDLQKYCKIVEKGGNPIYYNGETASPSRFQQRFEVDPPICLSEGLYFFDDDENNIPCDIKIFGDSKITIKYKTKKALDVEVVGHVEVDGEKLNQGMTRLEFKNFEKTGKLTEAVMTKSILNCYNDEISAIDELIELFDEIVD